MLSRIIQWSGRNPFLVLLATLFVVLGGIVAVMKTPLDALPDLSDVQVIVYTEYPGQAPQVVEDQVTYPLTTAMLAVPKSKVVRGFSFFGASFVYVIFEDGTDIYWARSRVLEYLNFASSRLPKGVSPSLGPDATGVGWVYQYVLLAKDKTLAELRTIQDWYVRYQLTKAPGVAEVASLGGFVQTYQVTVDPLKLRSFGIPLMKVSQVIRDSNRDVGGRVVEMAGSAELYGAPRHPYTQALLASAPIPDPSRRREHPPLKGDVPSPLDPPRGCTFHPRCPLAEPGLCDQAPPPLVQIGPKHQVACYKAT